MWWVELLNSIVALLESGAGGGGGAYESIATTTLSSTSTSISFTGIPSTYQHLQLRILMRSNIADTFDSNSRIFFNNNTSSYVYHQLIGNGSSASASGFTSASSMNLLYRIPTSSQTSGVYTAAIVDIHDYASTTKNKTVRCFSGTDINGNTNYAVGLFSGLWMNTAAINQI